MLRRVSACRALLPFSRLAPSPANPEAPAASMAPLAAPPGTLRTENNIQRYLGTSSMICSKTDEKSATTSEISKKTSESKDKVKENIRQDLLGIIKDMKIELNTINVQTTKPPSRKHYKSLDIKARRRQRSTEDTPEERTKSLSPELVAAASAVAESLPFDKNTTKSELLQQLQQHEADSRAQKAGEKRKISFSNIISEMKVAKQPSVRVNTRPEHQIKFDEGSEGYLGKKNTADLQNSFRKSLFMGKRLNIFDQKTFSEEASEAETPPSLWEIEFAKQLATVNEQPFQNGFEEMIQWTKQGKLWEFPIDNEAGFDDDGSEFHEHVFLDKYLEGFPKQGPIRHFMELVTCGLSKNPYLSVKQKVEHIEWFRNYFNEKRDILKENNIQFN
ncbi:28S ribosomal protein S31, mitochondrial isoform X2 [Perognathus longimembris pacificus]|uniref:28S ribosomal protein S31, mitochondrial isoform X2 n=1 Tax=Perognathus longimembris pacificus TaxID=214514 RepID=UPI0020193DA4|nr:28S ribosomal protein S31, mitochondrial isoform X2 [Perognathus longimembris pacificus]